MRSVNIPSGCERNAEVGLVWRELQAPGGGNITLTVKRQNTLRISAGALTTVKIDNVVAITLRAGEVERINVGAGEPDNNTTLIVVEITSSDVAVQIALETDPGRLRA